MNEGCLYIALSFCIAVHPKRFTIKRIINIINIYIYIYIYTHTHPYIIGQGGLDLANVRFKFELIE